MQGECAPCTGQPDQAVLQADGENEAGGRIEKFTAFYEKNVG